MSIVVGWAAGTVKTMRRRTCHDREAAGSETLLAQRPAGIECAFVTTFQFPLAVLICGSGQIRIGHHSSGITADQVQLSHESILKKYEEP